MFSEKRFVDIGQTLFPSWIRDWPTGAENSTQEENCKEFNIIAKMAFDAAREFAKVFENQENERL